MIIECCETSPDGAEACDLAAPHPRDHHYVARCGVAYREARCARPDGHVGPHVFREPTSEPGAGRIECGAVDREGYLVCRLTRGHAGGHHYVARCRAGRDDKRCERLADHAGPHDFGAGPAPAEPAPGLGAESSRAAVESQTARVLHRTMLALELKALACWLNGSDSDHERIERAEKRCEVVVDELTGHDAR